MKLEDLTIPQENIAWQECLQHWAWLLEGNPEFRIWIVTKFAEIIVTNDDGEVWFISTSIGSYEKVANSREAFIQSIDDQDNLDLFFMPQVIKKLEENNLHLGDSECYGFQMPLIFKESDLDVGNLKVVEVEAYLAWLGNFLGSIEHIPCGEKVSYKFMQ